MKKTTLLAAIAISLAFNTSLSLAAGAGPDIPRLKAELANINRQIPGLEQQKEELNRAVLTYKKMGNNQKEKYFQSMLDGVNAKLTPLLLYKTEISQALKNSDQEPTDETEQTANPNSINPVDDANFKNSTQNEPLPRLAPSNILSDGGRLDGPESEQH